MGRDFTARRTDTPDTDTKSDMVLAVNNDHWRLHLVNVTRMASDWFVQFAVIGPRAHTIFLRSDAPPSERKALSRLLARVRDWLGQDDHRPCAFIDMRKVF
jgi:hypothetical protein